jgi:hypothetical protein
VPADPAAARVVDALEIRDPGAGDLTVDVVVHGDSCGGD